MAESRVSQGLGAPRPPGQLTTRRRADNTKQGPACTSRLASLGPDKAERGNLHIKYHTPALDLR